MNVEDSYEGAVRRLQRLEQAGFHIPLERENDEEDLLRARVRDLEELASVACDENERLEAELKTAQDQVASLQRIVTLLEESAAHVDPHETQRLESQLAHAQDQIASLQRLIARLEESADDGEKQRLATELESARQQLSSSEQQLATAQQQLASALDQVASLRRLMAAMEPQDPEADSHQAVPAQKKGAPLAVALAAGVAGALLSAGLMSLRPNLPSAAATLAAAPVVQAAPVAAPVVQAAPVAAPVAVPPKIEVAAPKIETPPVTAPAVTVPKVKAPEPAHAEKKAKHLRVTRRPAKHKAKHHVAAKGSAKEDPLAPTDPLAGLNL
jgi:hypothetical protein